MGWGLCRRCVLQYYGLFLWGFSFRGSLVSLAQVCWSLVGEDVVKILRISFAYYCSSVPFFEGQPWNKNRISGSWTVAMVSMIRGILLPSLNMACCGARDYNRKIQ